MSRSTQLDTNALIALADPAAGVVAFVRERVMAGLLPGANRGGLARVCAWTASP